MAFDIPTPLSSSPSKGKVKSNLHSSYRPNPDIGFLECKFDQYAKDMGLKLTVSQRRFVEEFFTGANLCLSGAAGTGKSMISKVLFDFLTMSNVSVGRTGTTGVASFNIGGQTIHSWAGLGLADEDVGSIIAKIVKRPKVRARIRAAQILFIDEASMAKGDLLNKLNGVMKHFRYSREPWGGCQIIFVSDFLQLPPVFKGDEVQELAFHCDAWRESNVKTIVLKEIVRQAADQDVLLKVLNEIRVGKTSSLHLLESRVGAVFPHSDIEPVRIFCKNVDVDEYNKERLAKLVTTSKIYIARDSGLPHHTDAFNKNCQAPQILELKIGAQVTLLVNLDTERGFVNGSIGVVKAFGPQGITVKFLSGSILVDHHDWHIKEQEVIAGKIIYRTVATRTQIPLRLAYASTVHRCQGQTLDRVIIDMRDAFATGQIYVALSRVRSLDSLSIVGGIPHTAIKVNQQCVEFYQQAELAE